jgi:dihydrodipicolinate synthase/N-acetylneuraminate lyase
VSESLSTNEIKERLNGPVNSIPTPFLADGQIDMDGFRNIIEVGISGGSGVSLLTYGDSQFDHLSDDEVTELTRSLVDQTAGRALTVAATRRWNNTKAVEFAHFCKEIGADILMVLPSDHALPQGKITHYREIADVMPLMLVGWPPHEILDALVDHPNICSFKEDGAVDYAPDTMQKYSPYWRFMTGGGLWRNYTQWPWNPAYFSFFSSFAPHVSAEYWAAYQRKDAERAGTIIREIEKPFTSLATQVGGQFQALWRAAFELNGISARYLRAPMVSATDAEMEMLKGSLETLGLITHPLST